MGSNCALPAENIAQDRRRSRRRKVCIPCALKVGDSVYPGRLLDLSSGGAFVQFAQLLDCGAEVSIVFKIRKKHKLTYMNLKARVTYVGRFLQGYSNFYGFGASFTSISHHQTAILEKMLDGMHSNPKRKFALTN